MSTERHSLHEGLEASERDYQDRQYRRWLGQGFFETQWFRRLVAWNLAAFDRAVHPSPSMRLLSLGCGTGEYEVALAARVAHVTGVDFSGPAIAHARQRASLAHAANVEFIEAPFRELSFAPASFDVVYAMGVLHHIPHAHLREDLLSAAHGWLKPGGRLYVREPSRRGLIPRIAYRFVRQRTNLHSPNEEHLDPRDIAEEIRRAGFTQVTVDFTDILAGPMPWLVRASAGWFWRLVFAFDRVWLSIPGLRQLASQFAITGVR